MTDIQGHRGARALYPENTLEGFLSAAALGVTGFELDVGVTADGVVVVHHDLTLNPDIARDASGAWIEPPGPALSSLTFSELQTYDVGRLRPDARTARLFPAQMPRDGARVPMLEQVLRSLPDARFTIEVKTDPSRPQLTVAPEALGEAVLAVIDRTGAADRVVLEAFDWRVQRHLRRLRTNLKLAYLTRSETISRLWWDTEPRATEADSVAAEDGIIWAPDQATLTEARVRHAHDLGLHILAWTVNEPADMRRLIGWGVDGLISDRPDLALAAAREADA